MIIRPMRLDDIPRVLAIAETADHGPRWAAEAYHRALDPAASPPRIALVAEDPDSGLAGFLITALIPPQAELETIVVDKPAQRQGIGRHLMEQLITVLKVRRITDLWLEVRESNHRALALYRTLGFVLVGRRGGYYSEPEEDAILMQRSLLESEEALPSSG